MGLFRYFGDRLVNLVAGLGTGRDKAAASSYALSIRDDMELASAYRSAWLPRKIVDIPALDACRKWRNWQADADQITKIEAEEKRLGLKAKTLEALTKARLFGGAAIFIGTGDADPSAELKPEAVRQLQYLAVMTRRQLAAGEIENDPMSPFFGRPRYYTLSGVNAQTQIHPSRLVVFIGADLPDNDLCPGAEQGWGDSVLQAVFDAVQNSDSTIANVASLVFEAKVDVFKVPDLMQNIGEAEYREKLLERFRLAAMSKGINGALLMDALEEHEQKSASFAGLPDVIDRMLQAVSGAADIPVTRLLGQSPGGLNSTGESDLRNYYDRVQSMQELRMTPALTVLDECLIRSALGSRPPEVFYDWASLWQTTSKERADIGKVSADTIKTLRESSLFADDALSKAATNMLVELNVLPGLEAAIEEFGERDFDQDRDDEEAALALRAEAQAAASKKGEKTEVGDAEPRPLYVHRKVTNADEIIAWAKAQGFEATLPADDLHVTIAFSRAPVDWMKAGADWSSREDGGLTVKPGGARLIERFDGGAVVLLFNSSELSWRHEAIKQAGASWDFPDYQPHITVTYQPGNVDLSKVEPYRGAIELGPEVFEPLDEDWKSKVREE